MSTESYTLNIYNPATKQVEMVTVPKEVYDEYRRGGWTIENNDRRFRRHETPFTDLRGNHENFDEFASNNDLLNQLLAQELQQAIAQLDESERNLLLALFLHGQSERQIAASKGVSQVAIHKQKRKIIKKLQKVMI
ncbi:MAG: sigma-70 family RNA polymerase sigma factor [Oscillospiraceae bacterium]|nr:sigma-70 family RNA polymerase sigma factor [Oscillospiraceae bacterium]